MNVTFNVLIPFQREASEGSLGWFLRGVAECVLDHMYKRSKSYWSEALIAPLISRYCYSVAVKLMRGIFFHHCYFCYYTYYYYHHHSTYIISQIGIIQSKPISMYLTLCEMQCCSWKSQNICSFDYPYFMTPDMTYKSLLSDYNQVWSYGKIVADM